MQETLFELKNIYKGFGGGLLKGANARSARPISTKHAIHVVMHSEIAKGSLSLRHRNYKKRVDDIVVQQAKRWGVRIYKYANAGNHLHILLRPSSRRRFVGFLRSVSGIIARTILGAQRGAAKGVKFWQARPFTRLIKWGAAFRKAKEYVELNAKEALGFLSQRRIKKMGIEEIELYWSGRIGAFDTA